MVCIVNIEHFFPCVRTNIVEDDKTFLEVTSDMISCKMGFTDFHSPSSALTS